MLDPESRSLNRKVPTSTQLLSITKHFPAWCYSIDGSRRLRKTRTSLFLAINVTGSPNSLTPSSCSLADLLTSNFKNTDSWESLRGKRQTAEKGRFLSSDFGQEAFYQRLYITLTTTQFQPYRGYCKKKETNTGLLSNLTKSHSQKPAETVSASAWFSSLYPFHHIKLPHPHIKQWQQCV